MNKVKVIIDVGMSGPDVKYTKGSEQFMSEHEAQKFVSRGLAHYPEGKSVTDVSDLMNRAFDAGVLKRAGKKVKMDGQIIGTGKNAEIAEIIENDSALQEAIEKQV